MVVHTCNPNTRKAGRFALQVVKDGVVKKKKKSNREIQEATKPKINFRLREIAKYVSVEETDLLKMGIGCKRKKSFFDRKSQRKQNSLCR